MSPSHNTRACAAGGTGRARRSAVATLALVLAALVAGCTTSAPEAEPSNTPPVTPSASPPLADAPTTAEPGASEEPGTDDVIRHDDEPEVAASVATTLETIDDAESLLAITLDATRDRVLAGDGGSQVLPDGVQVAADAESWERRGNLGAMVVTVESPNGPSEQLAVFVVRQDDGWRVASTAEVAS